MKSHRQDCAHPIWDTSMTFIGWRGKPGEWHWVGKWRWKCHDCGATHLCTDKCNHVQYPKQEVTDEMPR